MVSSLRKTYTTHSSLRTTYASITTYVSCSPYWQSVGVSKLVQTEGKGGIWDTHRNITMAHTFGILRTKRCQYSLATKCVCCVRINKKLGPCTIKVSLLPRFFTLILKELYYCMLAQNLFINSNINNQGSKISMWKWNCFLPQAKCGMSWPYVAYFGMGLVERYSIF